MKYENRLGEKRRVQKGKGTKSCLIMAEKAMKEFIFFMIIFLYIF